MRNTEWGGQGHVERMRRKRDAYRSFVGKPEERSRL